MAEPPATEVLVIGKPAGKGTVHANSAASWNAWVREKMAMDPGAVWTPALISKGGIGDD
jgi:hypothetical protein